MAASVPSASAAPHLQNVCRHTFDKVRLPSQNPGHPSSWPAACRTRGRPPASSCQQRTAWRFPRPRRVERRRAEPLMSGTRSVHALFPAPAARRLSRKRQRCLREDPRPVLVLGGSARASRRPRRNRRRRRVYEEGKLTPPLAMDSLPGSSPIGASIHQHAPYKASPLWGRCYLPEPPACARRKRAAYY